MRLSTHTPLLKFDSAHRELTDALSAALFVGDHLWLASDEATSVERLATSDGLTFGDHETFPLEKFFRLPAHGSEFDQEIDIEGLDYDDHYLWVVGSHSIKRKKVEGEDSGSAGKKIKKLAKTVIAGNRFILARVPLVMNADSRRLELSARATDPADSARVLTAARLPGDVRGNSLTKAVEGLDRHEADPHLAPFLSIPGKDNGFDIEGLAVAGDRIFLGLRGPVLRGWAVVLEVSVGGGETPELALENVGPDGRPYQKHFLDLGGLGVRELCVEGSNLLVLAGPTMNLDGPVVVFRWEGALRSSGESLVGKDRLKPLFVVPHGEGTDHAEGMTLIPGAGRPRQVLIVYDSPSEQRKEGTDAVRADVFDLPG